MPVSLKLKPNAKARVLKGHPWVFDNEVEALLPSEHDGEAIECTDRTGRFIGTGIYNSRSQIVWRRLSRDRVTLDNAYLRSALEGALKRRPPASDFRRLVWSESDDLPGVVVDQFGDTLVVQTQTLAMSRREMALAEALQDLVKPAEIIFRNDAPIRRLEGLPMEVRTLSGKTWEPRWAKIDGLAYWLDLQGGQKTGFYLDQVSQHRVIARQEESLVALGTSPRVLDAFCNQGPFALQAARAGAAFVRGLDSAEDAIVAARRNAEHNGLKVEFVVAHVFDYFTERREDT